MQARFILPFIIVLLLNACSYQKFQASDSLQLVQVYSPSLKDNLLNDSASRDVLIYLPPSYHQQSDKHYPVVYLLHGYGATHRSWIYPKFVEIDKILNQLIQSQQIQEMIVVMPNAYNRYGGSFYTNSIVTGDWEDFITQDLVAWVDQHYRTLTQAQNRGIAGHSMGGYGAIKIAMKHPEVFRVVYGISACCLAMVNDLTASNLAWLNTFDIEEQEQIRSYPFYSQVQVASSAAFSPDPDNWELLVAYPFQWIDNQLKPHYPYYQQWLQQLPSNMVQDYQSNLQQLSIGFEAGKNDHFSHIYPSHQIFAKTLDQYGIKYQFFPHSGGHADQVNAHLSSQVFPFLSQHLEFQ